MKLVTFALAASLSFTTKAYADPDPNFDIFLCFGQPAWRVFPKLGSKA
jgi:hypothetical protein